MIFGTRMQEYWNANRIVLERGPYMSCCMTLGVNSTAFNYITNPLRSGTFSLPPSPSPSLSPFNFSIFPTSAPLGLPAAMVGIMTSWGDRAAGLLQSATATGAIPSKMKQLRQLREVLLNRDPSLITKFAPRLAAELQADCASPVRKFLAELIGEIGLKDMELIPEMVPTLISFLKDETAAVARQAITTGTSLFRNVLEQVVIQGAYSSELDDSLKSCWAWMLKFKNSVLPIAFQSGIDGVRLLAVKFVEAMVLLYTPDPNVPSDSPHEVGDVLGFNITWVKGGHPMLNVGDLSMEATQSLRLLLDQLRPPKVRSLSNSIIMVLTNSLSAIAARRPSFYGRILPVLLTLDPASSVIKGVQVPGAHHALKSAFLTCWKCTHSSAEPWRPRLVEALKAMNADAAEDLNDVSGIISVSTEGLLSTKEHNTFLRPCETYSDIGRKRHFVEDSTDLSEDDTISGKRIRPSVVFQVPAKETFQTSDNAVQNNHSLLGSLASTRDGDSGPAQQLVGMFGALVAQGVKAAGSLEILTSSISPDLLAEVVMANLRYLPPTCPKADEEEVREGLSVMQPTGNVSDNFSLSTAFPLIASLLNVQPVISHDIAEAGPKYEAEKANRAETPFVSSSVKDSVTRISTSIQSSVSLIPPRTEQDNSAIPLYINDVQGLENKIPGLESTSSLDEMQESLGTSLTSTGEMQGIEQEQTVSLGSTVPLDISSSGCMTTYSSETFSPSIAGIDPSQAPSSSPGTSIQYVLPKMSVPNVILTDEQKDQLLKVAYLRILEAYKHVAVSGGSHIRFSLLAHLGIEFPLELDSWGLIQKHVLLDYSNHEGHELTLRVLFRLYREVEQDQDFLSSRTATSVYESFLLAVAEALRNHLPASDKSLGRLLGEVPYLSDGVLKLLECLCSPEGIEKNDKVFQNGDRVTQGLTAVWNLIMLRPSNRDRCLQIALESTVHHLEEVRKKAIRLVANKLFPMASISKKIEDFADEKLHSVINNTPMDILDADGSISESQKDDDMERLSSDGQALASTSDNHAAENAPSSSFSEAQRWMSLYFALCTKKHLLLVRIFAIYQKLPKAAKQAVHRQVPILVRTIGSSPALLDIIADPPIGSENLLMQVLQTLTDAAVPPQNLIPSIKRLYNSKQKDVQVLIPVLPFLSKDEVLSIFPQFVNLPLDKFQGVLARILQESPQTSSSLNPAEVLIAIHGIDSERDGVPLKKVMDACSACFEQRNIFTEQVLAKVLNQLVEQIPLPLLFMRTVIQAIGVYPALVDFVMEILSRLVSKQIWKYPKLWVGFLKCAIQTRPQSFSVLLKLPAVQLENALTKNPVLKPPLVEHANLPNIRSTLPRSTLVVLGLVNDSQASGQAQASQSQAADTSSSAADTATEVTEENAVVS